MAKMVKFCYVLFYRKKKVSKHKATIKHGKSMTEVIHDARRACKEKALTVPAGKSLRDYN